MYFLKDILIQNFSQIEKTQITILQLVYLLLLALVPKFDKIFHLECKRIIRLAKMQLLNFSYFNMWPVKSILLVVDLCRFSCSIAMCHWHYSIYWITESTLIRFSNNQRQRKDYVIVLLYCQLIGIFCQRRAGKNKN